LESLAERRSSQSPSPAARDREGHLEDPPASAAAAGPLRFAGLTIHYQDEALLRELLWEIFVEQRYELGELPEQAQVFDVGANIGIATLFFATRSPGVRIQAYEPDPETFLLLQRNVQENGLENVQLHNCALSDRSGMSELHVRREIAAGDIGASLEADYRHCFHKAGSIEVRSVRLKKLSDELKIWGHADVLKLDIEGAEAGVFRDLGENFQSISRWRWSITTSRDKRTLCLES
jgi:FkbM family methyltransferase